MESYDAEEAKDDVIDAEEAKEPPNDEEKR